MKSEKMLIELVQAWYFDTEQLGQFFNEGQAKLSFYPENLSTSVYKEPIAPDPVTLSL
ncbi:hypothetical protein DFH05DRAFT_1531436 [Lentinula detonsa]|uniref:Uncharacterized protein n=1 Tax=Lentinula detonsa TaxID=2804962 RepID=A0A9W8NP57_9AGAR|nr:hypothetical protein DFH05DRAFT_1531436 [Lentinula detonsa]